MSHKGSSKFISRTSGIITAIALALILAFVPAVSADKSYPDVLEGESHYEAIMALTKEGIVTGYDDGTFRYWNDITRQHVAVIFYRAFDLEVPQDLDSVLSVYDDVDSTHLYAEEIAAVTDAGVFNGKDGSFLPIDSITRQQVASAILRATDLDEFLAEETQEINLENVDESHEKQVQIVADLGVTNQFEDFRPEESISRGAFSTMFYRLDQKIEELGNSYKLFDKKVIKDINVDNMYNTIEFLSQEPRVAGTEGEYKTVKWLESEFESLGYEVELQPFTLQNTESEASVTANGEELDSPHVFGGSASDTISAQLVDVKKAYPEEIGDEVKGNIALMERGELNFTDKIQNVLDKGAIGVIMYNSSDSGNSFGQVGSGQDIPAVAITKQAGLELLEQLGQGEVSVTLDVKVEVVEVTSHNVIATMKPDKENDTDQIIAIGAHHDSVPGSPGANDDASGVSAVLELARIYAEYPIDTEVRFLTFGAEERGLLGSRHYVQELPQEDIDRMVALYQMDMIAAQDAGGDHPLGGLIMYTVDGETNLVTDFGAASGFKMLSETLPYGQLGRSDHVPFHDAGIPAALFIHSPVEPWYHTPEDTMEKIDTEKLQQVTEIVGTSTYQVARPETPRLPNLQVGEGLVDYPFENRPVQ